MSYSSAIDKGDNTAAADLETDVEGNIRIFGEKVDLGAYEYQGDRDDTSFYSTVVNTLNDSFDLEDDEWSLREAIFYAPEYVTITFADDLEGTIVLELGELEIHAALAIDGDGCIAIDADQQGRVIHIYAQTEVPVVLNGLTIQNGYGEYCGGGIYNEYGALVVTNCLITGNESETGGGIYNDYSSLLTIINSTIAGNKAAYYGGGILASGTVTITNSTISGNTAPIGGGIASYEDEFITLVNSIVTLNYSDNLFGDLTEDSTNNLIGRYPGFVYDPIFDSEGNLTNAETMDLHLLSYSSAIDKGDNTAVADIETDIEGHARIYGETVDIGAYEYQGDRDDTSFYSTVVNTLNDSFDLDDGEWSLREAIFYSPEYVTITFADGLEGTIVLERGQLEINAALAIDGDGRIVIDADQQSRVFYVSVGTEEEPVVLDGLTIQNGSAFPNEEDEYYGNDNINYGGGIYNAKYSFLKIVNSNVTGNEAESYGGGIYNSYCAELSICNSTISGNASYEGGGIYSDDYSTLTVVNSTISGNTAASWGGILNYGDVFTVINSIVSLNYSGNIHGDLSADSTNNLFGYYPGFVCAPEFDIYGQLTNADTMDLHLLSYSSAIDKGDNTVAADIESDVEGNVRIFGETVDLGAYEYQGDRNDEMISTIVNTLNDSFDPEDDEWSLREILYYAPNYITITFADELEGTIELTLGQLEIDAPLAIDGAGRIAIDAKQNSRVFYISTGSEVPVILNGLTIQNGKISGNGGGIYNDTGALTITNSEISGSSASNGGGIYNNSTLTISNSEISGNTAPTNGGGVYNNSVLTIASNKISGNTASNGGGIYNNSTLTLTSSEISGNTASSNGGGIYSYASSAVLEVINSTISGNTASTSGGIYNNSAFTITNSIVTMNHSGNIYQKLSDTSTNNLIGYYQGFVCIPEFDSSGHLTNADTMDLHLRSDSSAIDKGDNAAVTDIETDVEGHARIFGDKVDLGAYEYQGDRNDEQFYFTVVNTLNDSFDPDDDEWSLREAICYAPEYVTITFADDLEGSLVLTLGQLEISAPLVIDGDDRIVIDADEKSRAIYISTGSNDPVVLKNLTVQKGKIAAHGAGIYVSTATTLTVEDCLITSNQSTGSGDNGGAGIACFGNLTLLNSTVSDNKSVGLGAGVRSFGSAPVVTITDCIVSGNVSTGQFGGGLVFAGTTTITRTEISGNTTSGHGGGIYAVNNPLTVIDCVFSGNTAKTWDGGAIFVENQCDYEIIDCVISENTAGRWGGAIDYRNCTGKITGCEITGN